MAYENGYSNEQKYRYMVAFIREDSKLGFEYIKLELPLEHGGNV